MSVLQATSVYKSYESEGAPVRALRGLDFTLDEGEFVAIMGPSGCGKSTFLNLVAGLDTPSDGEIVLAGISLSGKDENQLAHIRRKHIGIVFQFFNLLEGMSVLENVTLPAVIAGMGRKQAESRARDLLDLLGLGDKARSAPGLLSGGQRQRLAIARALANQPTLLLADEPTGALDSEGGAEVLELFRRLHAEGQAILLVTHAVEVAEPADRIVHMRDGRVEGMTVGAAPAASANGSPGAAAGASAASPVAPTAGSGTAAAGSGGATGGSGTPTASPVAPTGGSGTATAPPVGDGSTGDAAGAPAPASADNGS